MGSDPGIRAESERCGECGRPGRDFAGLLAGDEFVWGSVPGFGMERDGSHAEYAVVPKEAISVAPRNLSAEQAAAVRRPAGCD
jgi:NADPH:quinone reductase